MCQDHVTSLHVAPGPLYVAGRLFALLVWIWTRAYRLGLEPNFGITASEFFCSQLDFGFWVGVSAKQASKRLLYPEEQKASWGSVQFRVC